MARTEASPEEKFWHKTITAWKSKAKPERERMEKLAAAYRSRYWRTKSLDEDDDTVVEKNVFYAFADTLIANVVPLNPAVTVKNNREALKDSAGLREALVNFIFKREKFTEKLWKACTRAAVFPRAWLKVVWSEARERPIVRVINPHYVWFDMAAEDYEDIRYIIEVTPLSRSDFEARMKKAGRKGGHYRSDALDDRSVTFGKWPDWLEPDADGNTEQETLDVVRGEYEWTVIYEVYDFKAKKFYHYADGCERPLFTSGLPYEFLANPYMEVVFNDNLQDLGGMSDADLISGLVERRNEMDSLEMWHTRTSIPGTVIHQGLVDDPDAFMDAFEALDGPGQAIMLNAKPGVGIGQVMGQTPVTQLPIEWGRVAQRLDDNISFTLGLPSYARGEVGQSDVATELALSDTATRTRNARRQKVVYGAVGWAATAVVSLYREFMPQDQKIPVRLTTTEQEREVTRELLGFDGPAEDPWDYDYEVHPFSAEEANSTVQAKNISAFLPVYMAGIQSGHIDARAFFTKLTELHRWPQLLSKNPPQGGGMPSMPGQQGAAAGASGQGMPPEMAAMMGGQVPVGSGDQAVPAGLEGGTQPGATPGRLGGMAPYGQPV